MNPKNIADNYLRQTSFVSEEDFKAHLELLVPQQFNFAFDVVDQWANIAPDKTALIWANEAGEERTFSFGEIKDLSDKAATFFLQQGIGQGDRVMLILKRRFEWWIAMIALHKIGAVAIPATHMLTVKDIVYRNQKAEVKAIICVGEDYVLSQIQGAMSQSDTVKILISVGPHVPQGFIDWQRQMSCVQANSRLLQKTNNNNDVMLMYFTSGTSGEPKMVAHNYLYPIGHIITAKYWHNIGEDDIHLTVADTGWAKAVWGKLYGQWFVGAAIFVYDHEKFTADKILRQIERHHITSFCAPPTVYRFLIHEDFKQYNLSSLRYCTTAGEALNASVYEKFLERTGIKLMEGFGQTETTLTLATMPWITPKPGSMGKPNPLYHIELLRPDGTPCEDGEKGQIVVCIQENTPPGLFMGYYGDKALTQGVMHDGKYYTGDIAWRDEDGFYWFVGRADDVIKSSGYRIGPFEVESALMTHPAVVECAITGVPDEIRGMVVKATVVLHADWKSKNKEELIKILQDHVKKVTAPYKYPRIIEFVEELPKTISGKIRRVEIREKDQSRKG